MALYGKIKAKLGGKPFCTMVVLAAGSSKRMGRDKLMMEVGGVPVLVRSLQAMQNCAAVDELIVGGGPVDCAVSFFEFGQGLGYGLCSF